MNYLMTESGGLTVSVLKMHAVSTAHCAQVFWWHWFNAVQCYYFSVGSSEQENLCTHFFSLDFHPVRFAETCLQAYS